MPSTAGTKHCMKVLAELAGSVIKAERVEHCGEPALGA